MGRVAYLRGRPANAIDTARAAELVARVASLRHFVALVLLALWLPTTQHCRLEAAGVIEPEASHDTASACCENAGNACAHDGCKVVEGSLVKSTHGATKAPAPTLLACASFLCLQSVTPDTSVKPVLAVTAADRPREWVPAWHFVRRTAPPSRAPSLVG